ncbi:hypothetical protein BDAP_000973 [Binucleata daphniae]
MHKNEVFLKNCINFRLSLQIKNIRNEIERMSQQIKTKNDCKLILQKQRQIFAMKELIKANWEETKCAIDHFENIKTCFEYKKIKKYEAKQVCIEKITQYLSKPCDDVVNNYWNYVKKHEKITTLCALENRLMKLL